MSQKVRKFINPRFVNTLDLSLMRRLLERSKKELKSFDLTVLDGDEEGAREKLREFFAGPIDGYPAALRGDLHRIADLGTAKGQVAPAPSASVPALPARGAYRDPHRAQQAAGPA